MHPRGLYGLCLVEALERFAYYGMLAVSGLYLNEHLRLSEGDAAAYYGTFLGLLYLAPLLGGLLADRGIGAARAALLGAPLLAAGYLGIAADRGPLLVGALAVLAIGHGLFKPALPVLVARLYARGDPRRDAAFVIFFIFINVGSFFAPLVAGWTRSTIGWSGPFGAAGLAMVASGLCLAVLYGRLTAGAVAPGPAPEAAPDRGAVAAPGRGGLLCAAIVAGAMISFVHHYTSTSVGLWARDHVDLTFWGVLEAPLSPTWLSGLSAVEDLLLIPVLLWLLARLRQRGQGSAAPALVGLGMVLTALSFALIATAAGITLPGERASPLWIIGALLLDGAAQTLIAPLLYSLLTQLAAPRWLGTTLGAWFLTTAVANKLSGEAGELWRQVPHWLFFGSLAAIAVAATVLWVTHMRRLQAAIAP